MRNHRLGLLLIFGLLIMVPLRTAWGDVPFLVVLPSPADGTRFVPEAISGDGYVIAGLDVLAPPARAAGLPLYAASWTWAKGLTKLFIPAPNQVLAALTVSSDGRVFAGYFEISIRVNLQKGVVGGVQVPFLWTRENGLQTLAPFLAKDELIDFFGENEAGNKLVFGMLPGDVGKESLPVPGLTWSQKTGYQPVLAPPGIRFKPYAMTGDAQTLFGFDLNTTDIKTAFGRLSADGRFIPYAMPWQTLRAQDTLPSFVAVNPSGTVLVPPQIEMPIRIFGSPNRSFRVSASRDCSPVWIVGPVDNKGDTFVACPLDPVAVQPKLIGFRVTPDGKAQAVPQWLIAAGLSLVGWSDMWVRGVSDDGKTVFGSADYQGRLVFFAAHVP